MPLKLITAPENEPVTLAQAKAHLRVASTDDDDLIEALITTARETVENETGRALITQTWELALDYFVEPPDLRYVTYPYLTPAKAILLPKPPLRSLLRISYYDGNGDEVLLHDEVGSPTLISDLVVDTYSTPGRIVPASGGNWPSAQDRANAVTIRFSCGYGDDGESVPMAIRHAILLLVGHYYNSTEPVNVGASVAPIPMTVDYLLQSHRVLSGSVA
jgi:uncharacterized phiE125 gp8 family phage protein